MATSGLLFTRILCGDELQVTPLIRAYFPSQDFGLNGALFVYHSGDDEE
jgi:hypothetical protein